MIYVWKNCLIQGILINSPGYLSPGILWRILITPWIFEKIQNLCWTYLSGPGEVVWWTNQRWKILWYGPFNGSLKDPQILWYSSWCGWSQCWIQIEVITASQLLGNAFYLVTEKLLNLPKCLKIRNGCTIPYSIVFSFAVRWIFSRFLWFSLKTASWQPESFQKRIVQDQ
jgi:hypothetical protein